MIQQRDPLSNYNINEAIHIQSLEIGNKAANLQQLALLCQGQNNLQVPPFCPLNDTLIKTHLDQHFPQWVNLWSDFQQQQGDETAEIKANVLPILHVLRKSIIQTFQNHPINTPELITFLESMNSQHAMLMVRSTGEEDTAEVANPGGNESIAAVLPNITSVSQAIGQVVASYFSEKSLKQRLLSTQNNITQAAFVPVLLQQMIGEPKNGVHYSHDVVRSGVMYTGEGITRIQAAPGHGELVVNSKAAFDTFDVTRENVVYPEIARKTHRLVPTEHGLDFIQNPKALQDSASLPQSVVLRLAELGRKIEQHYGTSMDVEFIYEPKSDVIYPVQARPIPAGDVNVVVASSVPPAKIPELKRLIKTHQVERSPAHVIAPAGFAAKCITHANQVLICNNIDEALNLYLSQTLSPVQAVIVKNLSPTTSHEAAQFNSKAIPVLQVDDLTIVDAWLKREKCVVLIDPQRNQLLDFTTLVPDTLRAKEVLESQGLLETGLFTHPIAPITSQPLFIKRKNTPVLNEELPLAGDLIRGNPQAALTLLFSKIKKMPLDKNIYTQLLTSLDSIEAAKPQDNNLHATIALDTIRYALYQLAKVEPSLLPIFQQTMVISEEIERSLSRYSQTSYNDNDVRSEHLNLVSRLKSLITHPGNQDIFSNSVLQVFKEKKSRQAISAFNSEALTDEQQNYLTQFLKFNHIAFSQSTKQRWASFASECVKDHQSTQKLAAIIAFCVEHHMESYVMNQYFPQCLNKDSSTSAILAQLYDSCMESKQELLDLGIAEKLRTIHAWEQRVSEWSQAEKFESLWLSYEREIVPLVNDLRLNESYDLVTLSEHPLPTHYDGIPGKANLVYVMVDNDIFLIDKAKKSKEKQTLIHPGSLDKLDFDLPEIGQFKELTTAELYELQLKFKPCSIDEKWSIYSTDTVFDPEDMLDVFETDFAYVLSQENLFFVDKIKGTCTLSHIIGKELSDIKQNFKCYTNQIPKTLTLDEMAKEININCILQDAPFLDSNLSELTHQAVFSTLLNLTDLMDKTIKSIKSSTEYNNHQSLLIERFYSLLYPYHQLMRNWVAVIPNAYFDMWSKKHGELLQHKHPKNEMLSEISDAFLSKPFTPNQLLPSGTLSIEAAKIGSTATFLRQFDSDKVTLEDLFSLMHQNILSSVEVLSNSKALPLTSFPEELHPLMNELKSNKKLQLLSANHTYPILSLEYNLPLGNHSAKFTFEYNQTNNKITLYGYMFGLNIEQRMTSVRNQIAMDGPLFGANIKKEPHYVQEKNSIEFAWEFDARLMQQDVPGLLHKAMQNYGNTLDRILLRDSDSYRERMNSYKTRLAENKSQSCGAEDSVSIPIDSLYKKK